MLTTLQKLPLKIVLAEDDADDRFFFAKALNELAIDTHLTMVHDGEKLMEYLSEHLNNLPDVVFLDLSMPRKSGFECLAEIKEELNLVDLPVIMFSTLYPQDINYEQSMVKTLLDMGAHHFIRKPSGFKELKEVIEYSLRKVMENKPILLKNAPNTEGGTLTFLSNK
jgi:CheY-like chemotaxis protein